MHVIVWHSIMLKQQCYHYFVLGGNGVHVSSQTIQSLLVGWRL